MPAQSAYAQVLEAAADAGGDGRCAREEVVGDVARLANRSRRTGVTRVLECLHALLRIRKPGVDRLVGNDSAETADPVSYTHLTLPTILRV